MRSLPILGGTLATVVLFSAQLGLAQSSKPRRPDSTEVRTDDHSPQFSTGVTAGAMSFTGGRNEQALSVLLQFRPVSWLSFSAAPGFGRTTLGTLSSQGLTDMPLASAAQYSAATLPWSPAFTGFLSTLLSTGQSGSTLGIGRTSLAAGAGLSVSPVSHTYLSADASRPITNGTGNGSADAWISRSLGRVTPSLGYSAEIGSADSAATLARSIAGGVAFSIAYPITLAIDGSHGLSSGAPKWAVSVSLGTAFSGISPMSGGSIFGRLKNAFGSRASSSSGYSKTPNSGTSCKRLGTC
jgi:hypothetical protein